MSDYQIRHAEPAHFSRFDPADEETFTFDRSVRGYPGDTVVFAGIVSVSAGVNFSDQRLLLGRWSRSPSDRSPRSRHCSRRPIRCAVWLSPRQDA
jgi:hypothetical protein